MALVVSEIALASLLLVGAGLTLRSFQTVLRSDRGLRHEGPADCLRVAARARGIRTMRNGSRGFDEDRAQVRVPARRARRRRHEPPAARRQDSPPRRRDRRIATPTPDTPTRAHPRAVTLDYFRDDGHAARRRAALSQRPITPSRPSWSSSTKPWRGSYWPGARRSASAFESAVQNAWREVVGVVADVKHWGLDRPVNPEMYLPQKQMVSADGLTFVLATDGDPVTLTRRRSRAVEGGRSRSAAVERPDDGGSRRAIGRGAAFGRCCCSRFSARWRWCWRPPGSMASCRTLSRCGRRRSASA